ncbi:MAG: CRISPR-associated endonuclease Cas1, partial [Pyrinomonadaceae bacterium]
FLSQDGAFAGRLHSNLSKIAALRQNQYRQSLNPVFRLAQARAIVGGKIANFISFARRQNNADAAKLASLKSLRQKAGQAATLESLLGVEGAASAIYFRILGNCFTDGWKFEKRTSHPPKDAINSLLSLSYTLLYNRMTAMCNIVGLDPYLGFFHTAKHGHAAMASDLMEEFRPVFADALVLKLLNRKQIILSDVKKSKGKFQLSQKAFAVFLNEFEEKLGSRRRLAVSTDADEAAYNLSFAQIIERQARQMANVIQEKEKVYQPFSPK